MGRAWTQNRRVKRKLEPKTAVPSMDQTMAQGVTLSARLVSSANWAGLRGRQPHQRTPFMGANNTYTVTHTLWSPHTLVTQPVGPHTQGHIACKGRYFDLEKQTRNLRFIAEKAELRHEGAQQEKVPATSPSKPIRWKL